MLVKKKPLSKTFQTFHFSCKRMGPCSGMMMRMSVLPSGPCRLISSIFSRFTVKLREAYSSSAIKFLNVEQNFLTDSLAGAVDADFDTGTCEKHSCAKHGDTDCLAKPTRGRNQNFLRNMVPTIQQQDLLMVSYKLTRWFKLPEAASACLQKIVMKRTLVIASVPAFGVQLCQILTDQHVLEQILSALFRPRSPFLPSDCHAGSAGLQTG